MVDYYKGSPWQDVKDYSGKKKKKKKEKPIYIQGELFKLNKLEKNKKATNNVNAS